jgi:hypothetical protein
VILSITIKKVTLCIDTQHNNIQSDTILIVMLRTTQHSGRQHNIIQSVAFLIAMLCVLAPWYLLHKVLTQAVQPLLISIIIAWKKRRHNTEHNDTQHNGIQHYETQHEGLICDTQHNENS